MNSLILILSVALQIICGIHVVQTKRPLYWIVIILLFSYIGVAIYFIAEMLPDLRRSYRGQRAYRQISNTISPGRARRDAERQLAANDTLENRLRFARHSLDAGDYQAALDMYKIALSGMYATDPHIMLGLAQSQFCLQQYPECVQTLESLMTANPDFSSHHSHLLYARSLEMTGATQQALEQYSVLSQSYPGEEGRYRYAYLLMQQGQRTEATALIRSAQANYDVAPSYYKKEQKEWMNKMKALIA